MNKGDLVKVIADAAEITNARANDTLNAVLDSIRKSLKKGDKVKIGDQLNHGIAHPRDAISLLGETKGIHRITETLHDIYKNSGITVDRRNVETVVRGMSGFGIIKDEGSHKHMVKGDVVPLSSISSFNQNAGKPLEVNPHDAYGMILHKPIDKFAAGTRIDKNMAMTLAKKHKTITARHDPIDYQRTVIGVNQAPLKSQDWLARLGYRYLKRGLQDGATYGYNTDVHGYHPVPAFVTGQLGDPGDHGQY